MICTYVFNVLLFSKYNPSASIYTKLYLHQSSPVKTVTSKQKVKSWMEYYF